MDTNESGKSQTASADAVPDEATHPELVRHVFELTEIHKSDARTLHYDRITLAEVNLASPGRVPMSTRLHAWALGQLAEGRFEFGLYSAECNGVDEYDLPLTAHGEIVLYWNGDAGTLLNT